jgi:hypothetical protein
MFSVVVISLCQREMCAVSVIVSCFVSFFGFEIGKTHSTPFVHTGQRLCLGDGTLDLSTTLSRVQADRLAANDVGTLLDDLLTLGEDQFDVAGVGHVRVDLDAS